MRACLSHNIAGVGWQSTQSDIADVVGETVTFTLDADTYDEPDSKFTSIQWYRNGNAIHAGKCFVVITNPHKLSFCCDM